MRFGDDYESQKASQVGRGRFGAISGKPELRSSPPELVKGIMEELAAIFRERLMALLTAPDAKSAMAAAAAQAAK
ncbi:unnamed protein product [Effrenium voratum]|nr:unnamed protein product [Effrenium voratum]CAJ1443779.1 unnamed protein product [Effrenium voratum]